MHPKEFLALGITWALVGLVVVYVLPFGENLLDQIQNPTVSSWLGKKWVQVLVVGGIVTVGMGIFFSVARALRLPGEA